MGKREGKAKMGLLAGSIRTAPNKIHKQPSLSSTQFENRTATAG